WPYLVDMARASVPGFCTASSDFDPVAPSASPVANDTPASLPAPPAATIPAAQSFADVTSRPVDWLMRGWLARQNITSVVGWPGEGKSTTAVDLAAKLSRGAALPNGTTPERPLRVLYLGTEDTDSVLKC